jgi:hypothetical protein
MSGQTVGYSSKPLAHKLGLKPGMRLIALHAPAHYAQLLDPLPPGVEIVDVLERPAQIIHYFTISLPVLQAAFPGLRDALAPDGMLWISWPKHTSPLAGDVDESAVREMGLAFGLVDVKIAAVDSDWSGLKFVYRLEDR